MIYADPARWHDNFTHGHPFFCVSLGMLKVRSRGGRGDRSLSGARVPRRAWMWGLSRRAP